MSVARYTKEHKRIERRQYNLTVMGEISNESMAYAISERFMRIKTPYYANFTFPHLSFRSMSSPVTLSWGGHEVNWKIASKNATLRNDGNWDVFMEASYDRCGDDWDAEVCLRNNTITGHFIISKKTGQIIG